MHKYSKHIKQVIFFGVVGVVTLLIDLAVTTSLYHLLHFPPYLASGIGFLSGFFFNFPMNRKKVFHHSELDRFSLRTQIAQYIGLCIFNLFMTGILTQLLVHSGVEIAIAKILITAVIAVWNFLLFKLYIFSKVPTPDQEK
jgi:putative flippase GtrA